MPSVQYGENVCFLSSRTEERSKPVAMTQRDKIMQKAEKTARNLRMRARVNNDPYYKEASKAIMSLLGLLQTETTQKEVL